MIVVHAGRGAGAFLAAASFLMAAGALASVGVNAVNGDARAAGVSAALLAIAGTMAIAAVLRLVPRRPLLVVDSIGLLDNAPIFGAGLVKWADVREVKAIHVGGQSYLCVAPMDPRSIRSGRAMHLRAMMWTNQRLVGYPIAIPELSLGSSVIDLASQIEHVRVARC